MSGGAAEAATKARVEEHLARGVDFSYNRKAERKALHKTPDMYMPEGAAHPHPQARPAGPAAVAAAAKSDVAPGSPQAMARAASTPEEALALATL